MFSTGSAETDVGWVGNLNSHLMASCIRNIRNKNYQNPIHLVQLTIDNVGNDGDPFLRQLVYVYQIPLIEILSRTGSICISVWVALKQ